MSEFEEYTSRDEETGLVSTVDIHSAVQLIYRYCTNLYKSKFITLRPIWNLREVPKINYYSDGYLTGSSLFDSPNEFSQKVRISDQCSFEVTLQMPTICPMNKVVSSGAQPRVDIAKKAAALKGCIELHKANELTDRLLPKTEKDVLMKLDHLFPHWPQDMENGKIKISTKRHHPIKVLFVFTY